MNIEEALILLDIALEQEHLSDIQEIVFRGVWQGLSYGKISELSGYDHDYIRSVGFRLWQLLSKALNTKVNKSNVQSVLRRWQHEVGVFPTVPAPPPVNPYHDWGEAIDTSIFFGRNEELKTLRNWILQENCRLIGLLGMGGIGKTALSVKLARLIQNNFHLLVWRSLHQSPAIEGLVAVLQRLQNQPIQVPPTVEAAIATLMGYLSQHRCLILLDGMEAILQAGNPVGDYDQGYAAYGELLQRLGETPHQSCVILTSREQPKELALMEGEKLCVRTLQLSGLKIRDGQKLLQAKGLVNTDGARKELLGRYQGNPYFLKIAANRIQHLCGGNIGEFLDQDVLAFNGIRGLLDEHLARLTPLEQTLMFWLALSREPLTASELHKDIRPSLSKPELLGGLESLRHRSLIEKKASGFTQQPVVMEYFTRLLVDKIYQEILDEHPVLLRHVALVKTQASDALRSPQVQVLLKPLATQLQQQFRSSQELKAKLNRVLVQVQTQGCALTTDYGCTNMMNLMNLLQQPEG